MLIREGKNPPLILRKGWRSQQIEKADYERVFFKSLASVASAHNFINFRCILIVSVHSFVKAKSNGFQIVVRNSTMFSDSLL